MHKGILTPREKEVFDLLVMSRSTKEIAQILHISEKTVRNHIFKCDAEAWCKRTSKCCHRIIKITRNSSLKSTESVLFFISWNR